MSGRVLVVDDVATNRLLLRAKLSSAYYDVVVAENGTQALELARSEQPDMVMLDVMMPDMDGFEVCACLKSTPETAHIPVIMVTALDTPEERIRGLEAGADDFLSKPFNDLALFARVRNLMRMKMMFDELRLRDMTSRELGLADIVGEPEVDVEAGGPILLAPPSDEQGTAWAAQLSDRLAVPVIVTHSEREALNLARLELPDCFVVHQALGEGGDGLRLVSALRSRPETRQSAVILVVGRRGVILLDDSDQGNVRCLTVPSPPSQEILRPHVALGKSRLETLCLLVVGMVSARTVNLGHVACERPAGRRDRLDLPPAAALLPARAARRGLGAAAGRGLLGLRGRWTLVLDRTQLDDRHAGGELPRARRGHPPLPGAAALDGAAGARQQLDRGRASR